MDPTSREDLSALMDGELAAEPTRFLMRRLDHDPELAATWSRWHLVRACLASDSSRLSMPPLGDDFAARVSVAIKTETQPAAARRRHWANYVGGGALAAGVAVAALMLNVPNSRMAQPAAPLAHNQPAPSSAVAATSLAEAVPTENPVTPPWMLTRQPTVLSAQPASANIIYGTGLMQPDYLRRASYARDAALAFPPSLQAGMLGQQQSFPVVLLPEPPSSASAARH
ncbi:MAG TPA: sigma-E factor negative regulatory protein [Rhodanobacteraceae bacterium]